MRDYLWYHHGNREAVPAKHYGGMGLGLHIAREMIEAHGGQLTVDTEPGRGSTFTIHLPLEPN